MEGKKVAEVMVLSLMLLLVITEGSVSVCKKQCEKKCSGIDGESPIVKKCVDGCLAHCNFGVKSDCHKSCLGFCGVLWVPGTREFKECMRNCEEGCKAPLI